MGTFSISASVTAPEGKYACTVSFNGGSPEYYEVDSLDPVTINKTLQKVADDIETEKSRREALVDSSTSLSVVDGKLKEPVVTASEESIT